VTEWGRAFKFGPELRAGRFQGTEGAVVVEQVVFGGHQVGLGHLTVDSEPPLLSGSNGTQVTVLTP
jgi:hypothetical protein